MKHILLFSILLIFAQKSYSQNTTNFNLPPGSVINKKAETNKDFSEKLQQVLNTKNEIQYLKESNFLGQYSASEIEVMKTESPESYAYYIKADEFYKNLSPKVKAVFSVDDLWNIYMFNQKLKAQLADIK